MHKVQFSCNFRTTNAPSSKGEFVPQRGNDLFKEREPIGCATLVCVYLTYYISGVDSPILPRGEAKEVGARGREEEGAGDEGSGGGGGAESGGGGGEQRRGRGGREYWTGEVEEEEEWEAFKIVIKYFK